MKKSSLLLLFVLITAITHPQRKEVCTSKEVVVETLNEIHKCAAETKKSNSLNKEDTEIVTHRYKTTSRYLLKRRKKRVIKKTSIAKIKERRKVLVASDFDCAGITKVKSEKLTNISAKDLALYLAEKEHISFEEVEEIPLFKSCNENDLDKLLCFNTNMTNYIADNFEYDEEAVSKNEVENIHVSFVINRTGNVTSIKTKGYEEAAELHKSLVRLIENLPKFIPAKNKGKNVSVMYEFEMNLSL